MPTYEYRCPACSHEFELFQRMSDDPVARCPECGGSAERLISTGAGLLFKGEGFYITDYRSESYKKKAEKETKSGGPPAGDGAADKGGDGKASPSSAGDKAPEPKASTKPPAKSDPGEKGGGGDGKSG